MLPEPCVNDASPVAPQSWGGLFRLLSCHRTFVQVSTETRSICHKPGPAVDLLGCRIPGCEAMVFMAEDGGPLRLNLGPFVRDAALVVLAPKMLDGAAKGGVVDHLLGHYLAASPGGEVVANRQAVMAWETFELDAAKPLRAASSQFLNRMARLRAFAAQRSPVLPAIGRDVSPARDAIEFAAACFERAALQALMADAEQRADFPGWLALTDPSDLWLGASEVGLAQWLRDRVAPDVRRPTAGSRSLMAPDLDFLASAGGQGQAVTAGHALSRLKRARVLPRKRACVVSTIRNEGPYLVDWVAYHRALGFDEIFIFSNDCDDGSDEILEALDKSGHVTWIRNAAGNNQSPQFKAYGGTFGLMPEVLDYEWALAIDLDEYFVLDRSMHANLGSFLDLCAAREHQAVVLSWLMFGPDGQRQWSDRPVTERFTRRAPLGPSLVKSISQPRLVSHSHCHFPSSSRFFPMSFVDAAGSTHVGDPKFPQTLALMPQGIDRSAWINHYWFKSAEEFIVRRMTKPGGRAIVPRSLISRDNAKLFIAGHEAVDFVQDLRIREADDAVQSMRRTLLLDEAVRSAHAAALEFYRKAAAERVQANFGADDAEVRKLAGLALAAAPERLLADATAGHGIPG